MLQWLNNTNISWAATSALINVEEVVGVQCFLPAVHAVDCEVHNFAEYNCLIRKWMENVSVNIFVRATAWLTAPAFVSLN